MKISLAHTPRSTGTQLAPEAKLILQFSASPTLPLSKGRLDKDQI
jgi:hypothetical protein